MSKNHYLRFLYFVAIGAWIFILYVQGETITKSLISPVSLVWWILIGLVTAFEKWLWKLPGIHPRLVSRPNLNGSFKGELVSQWVNPETNELRPPIPSYLCIHQTLSTISIRFHSGESSSVSLLGSFIDSPDGYQELLYTYRNEPKIGVRDRSPIHYGAARLTVTEKEEQLEGPYWTDRQTIGSMRYQRVSRKCLKSFAECEKVETGQSRPGGPD